MGLLMILMLLGFVLAGALFSARLAQARGAGGTGIVVLALAGGTAFGLFAFVLVLALRLTGFAGQMGEVGGVMMDMTAMVWLRVAGTAAAVLVVAALVVAWISGRKT
ncbi:hypothetical protein [Psychromarinibacter sp. S121]|uniref:hypothetical protein n=1 Tax=Psychromarinibacter sp. S121 TaxID=3415127 RepID=UPI003C7EB29B